jgi:hypothetical protein
LSGFIKTEACKQGKNLNHGGKKKEKKSGAQILCHVKTMDESFMKI